MKDKILTIDDIQKAVDIFREENCPFQAGLIYRINDSEVYIAARKGGICVKDLKADKSKKIRVSLRFVTPPEILFSALTSTT